MATRHLQPGDEAAGPAAAVTSAVPVERIDEVVDAIERALARGERIYWICPVVEGGENEHGDGRGRAASAARRALRRCRRAWPTAASPAATRKRRSTAFATGATPPPGRDHCGRGRGRRARGQHHRDRACRALRARPAAPATRPGRPRSRGRPRVFCSTSRRWARRTGSDRLPCGDRDGFAIAEEDLRLRGPGRGAGPPPERPAGLPLRRPRPPSAILLVEPPASLAEQALAERPTPARPEAEPLRVLLHLFERHDAVRLFAAG